MKKSKKMANYLLYISRFCAFGYTFLTTYSAISLLTNWSLKLEGDYFNILFPLTEQTILIGEYNLNYIVFNYFMVFVLYGVFFWMLSNVFKVFTQPKLFTKKNIKQLKYFYLANLFIPSVASIIAYTFSSIDRDVIMLIILHFVIGIFTYFLAEIFRQGVQLQNEQDLII